MCTRQLLMKLIHSPFPFTKRRWLVVWGCTFANLFFVFLFTPLTLVPIDKPNGLAVRGVYGLLFFLILLFFEIILPWAFPKVFDSEKWTFGKQFLWASSIVLVCGMTCYYYSLFYIDFPDGNGHADLQLLFLLYTGVIGILIISFVSIIKYVFYQKRLVDDVMVSQPMIDIENETEVDTIITRCDSHKENCGSVMLYLKDENNNTRLEICLQELFYIESDGNYINVFFKRSDRVSSVSFRSTLKQILEENPEVPDLKRCHRAFVVNLRKVDKVDGNSRGMRLFLAQCNQEIPVSRNYVAEIKELLSDKWVN